MKKVLLAVPLLILLLVIIAAATNTYVVLFTRNVRQHPHHFPETSNSYDVMRCGILPAVVESSESIDCNKVAIIRGEGEKVVLGDGSGTLKRNYAGYHISAEQVFCIM